MIAEPTGEQCSARAELPAPAGHRARACWYPQMGGYVSKCVVVTPVVEDEYEDLPCFEAYVWSDGNFPFSDEQWPRRLHHCDAEQFVEFGQLVIKTAEGLG